jgi:large-conductance mechanosensitive channel
VSPWLVGGSGAGSAFAGLAVGQVVGVAVGQVVTSSVGQVRGLAVGQSSWTVTTQCGVSVLVSRYAKPPTVQIR